MTRLIRPESRFGWGVKVYPSGEFVLYRKKRKVANEFKEAFLSCGHAFLRRQADSKVQHLLSREFLRAWWKVACEVGLQDVCATPDPVEPVSGLMGLSALANSEKKRRGLGGLTRHGKVLVREAAIGLESNYGKDRLSFWTCTLPPMPPAAIAKVCEGWSGLLENVKKKLIYHLNAAGLPTHIVGVTEMQSERFKEEQYPAWHIHFVFVGRHPFRSWAFTPDFLDGLWQEAVEHVAGCPLDFRSSCKIQPVKKSVGGYLAKYLSKGSVIQEVADKCGESCVPSSWYICTKGLRDWVKKNVRSSEAIAKWVWAILQSAIHEVIAPWAFQLETDGHKGVVVCWMGRLMYPPPPLHELKHS